jgi:hypothetical protein
MHAELKGVLVSPIAEALALAMTFVDWLFATGYLVVPDPRDV